MHQQQDHKSMHAACLSSASWVFQSAQLMAGIGSEKYFLTLTSSPLVTLLVRVRFLDDLCKDISILHIFVWYVLLEMAVNE